MVLTEHEIRDLIDQRKPEKPYVRKDPMKYKRNATWVERCLTSLLTLMKM
ncbi:MULTISPECIES: hypothetical protein [Pontibacillus]|uniref:Uncharacterized protein n=1 Tax=Pontibacillus chungwhensis TaxID=265426 RepID=A0ABY8V2N8_9BACI|nr:MULTISPECIES: hypothetical protein [Pontibacillus]MCD5322457.1 hypothetical protein [Pontibacillus sp. HN14]WIF99743.1 hypothetical protein QNI29_08830 [Pontibacillus chungwhensis]